MPAKQLRLRCLTILTLVTAVFLIAGTVEAQTNHVTLQGRVSETIALSVLPGFRHDSVGVVNTGNTVRLTLSGSDAEPAVIRIPLLVRSNSAFKIAATFDSKTAAVTQLSVVDAVATGTLTSPQAVNALQVSPQFDPGGLSQPLLVFSGPRVSLGGTLQSPNNALQVTLLIRLQPQQSPGWLLNLTLVGTPE